MSAADRWRRSFAPVERPPPSQLDAYSTTAPAAAPASVEHRPLGLPQQQARSASPVPTAVPQPTIRPRAWSVDPSPGVQHGGASDERSESLETEGGAGTTSGTVNLDVDRWLEDACRGPAGAREESGASSSTTPAIEDIKPVLGVEASRPRAPFKPRLPPPAPKVVQNLSGRTSTSAFKSRLPPLNSPAPVPVAPPPAPSPVALAPTTLLPRPPLPRPHGLPEKPITAPPPPPQRLRLDDQATFQSRSTAPHPRFVTTRPPAATPASYPAPEQAACSTSTGSASTARAKPTSPPPIVVQLPPQPPPSDEAPTTTTSAQVESPPTAPASTSNPPSLSSKEKAAALLPRSGTKFASPETFYAACLKSCLDAFGLPTWKNNDSTTTLRAECSMRKSKSCRFSIAAVPSHGEWVVSAEKSRLEHNHPCGQEEDSDDDLPLAKRPPPKLKAPRPAPPAPPSTARPSPSKPSTSSSSTARIFQPLDPTTPAPPMVKVGDTFDSRFAIHTAASKAAYARGFGIVVSKSLCGGSVLGFSCRRGVNQSGIPLAQRCRFKLDVEVTTDDDGEEEEWKVIRLDEQHNHAPSTQEELGEWKEPRGEEQSRKYASKPSTVHSDREGGSSDGEESSDDDESSGEEFKPSRKRKTESGDDSEDDSDEVNTERKRSKTSSSPSSKRTSTSKNNPNLRSLPPLSSSSPAPPLPRVGDIFPSRLAFHTAAWQAGYARGFNVSIFQTMRENGDMQFACKKSVKAGGLAVGDRCPFRIFTRTTKNKKGEEKWKVRRVILQHNHAAESKAIMETWREPQKRRKGPKSKKGRGSVGRGAESSDDESVEAEDSSEDESSPRLYVKRERSKSTSSAPPAKKHRAASSLPTPRTSKTPPTTSRRALSTLLPDPTFLPSLSSFLAALSPSLSQFAPILLALGVDSVDAITELVMLEENEMERFVKLDHRAEPAGEGSRSLMELPPLERAKLKSSLKKARTWVDAGGAARPSL